MSHLPVRCLENKEYRKECRWTYKTHEASLSTNYGPQNAARHLPAPVESPTVVGQFEM